MCIWRAQPACLPLAVLCKAVKSVIEGIMGVAAEQLKKNGLSRGGMLNLKKPALQPAGRESFHQGAVRFQDQDQACFQDCACVGHEEDEGAIN